MELGVGNSPETGLVFDGEELSSRPTVPARIRRRLTDTKASGSRSSIEEIEAKLRNADLRRQKFYENLSSKARPKRRSPQSADDHNLSQSIEAKLQAAEQKRMQILKTQSQRNKTSQSLLRRCWRKFLKQKTTLDLAKAFYILNINTSHVISMPFEQFANLIENPSTLHTTKSLLDRLETRYRVLLPDLHGQDEINHLLTRVVSRTTKPSVRLSRYQPRIVLSAYMILGHPDAIFRGEGDRETTLTFSAKKFVQEFELLIEIILNGPSQSQALNHGLVKLSTFRSQILAFDAAWCSFLNSFVVWKVKDVESLMEDLVKAACQMEISMMKKYKVIPEGDDSALTDDVKAFQKQMQVTEHQKMLREQIFHLSGEAGINRLENALSNTRKKYFQSKEKTSPIQSTLKDLDSNVPSSSDLVNQNDEIPIPRMENVFIVNEFLHGQHYDSLTMTDENQKVRKTMEKAFWDGISDSIKQEKYDHVVMLMKEVRDELCEMSPQSQKQEIHEVIDLAILSQLLSSRSLDMEYLGRIMEFSLVSLQKLSAIAHENKLKESHQKVLSELAELCQAGDGSNHSHAIALIRGLRFVLEEIQVLKQEISKARIKMMEPLLKGPTGVEYLKKAFEKVYGPPSDALIRLPLTMEWLSSVVPCKDEEWNEHKSVLLELQDERTVLPSTGLRTGGSFSSTLHISSKTMSLSPTDNQYTECKGEKGDLLVRLGLVKLVNNVNGVMKEELPETLKLNFLRLRAVQTQLQKITVIATSILVLRQTLVMDEMISNPEDMERTMLKCSTQLSETLDTIIDAGLEELVEVLSKIAEDLDKTDDMAKNESRRVVMARMLRKSVQAGDPVFVKVSRAVYLATRGVVLVGGGNGREVAEKVLRQVGAAGLAEKVVEAGEVLGVMSGVSGNVHGPWYAGLIESM
ncbi:uncharacterized protein LOC111888231 [Lactuca sativa]|uniref:uncharacterized protein LOC111888231 n=1 Tax=Lactuca sativa TaxID=4236 RepID=UPI000CD96D78|nr:uncharacterized protein LOC111888231 [Lactuca sativa]